MRRGMGLGLLMAALATHAIAADLQWQAPSSDDKVTDATSVSSGGGGCGMGGGAGAGGNLLDGSWSDCVNWSAVSSRTINACTILIIEYETMRI